MQSYFFKNIIMSNVRLYVFRLGYYSIERFASVYNSWQGTTFVQVRQR